MLFLFLLNIIIIIFDHLSLSKVVTFILLLILALIECLWFSILILILLLEDSNNDDVDAWVLTNYKYRRKEIK